MKRFKNPETLVSELQFADAEVIDVTGPLITIGCFTQMEGCAVRKSLTESRRSEVAPCDEKHKAFNRFRFWFGQFYSDDSRPRLALNKLCEAEDELTEAWGL